LTAICRVNYYSNKTGAIILTHSVHCATVFCNIIFTHETNRSIICCNNESTHSRLNADPVTYRHFLGKQLEPDCVLLAHTHTGMLYADVVSHPSRELSSPPSYRLCTDY